MQGSGQRLLVLEPVQGCSINCGRVSVLLKPSDFRKFLNILVDGNILLGYVQVVVRWDSSVSIATRYGLDGLEDRIPEGVRFSSPDQSGPGAHPATYTMGTGRGFSGLEVSKLVFGTQVHGFKPGQSRRIFQGEKILSMPSFGGEVKPSVPCRRFAACKRSLQFCRCWQNYPSFLAQFPLSLLEVCVIVDVVAPGRASGNFQKHRVKYNKPVRLRYTPWGR
jgi:hypothetical protein